MVWCEGIVERYGLQCTERLACKVDTLQEIQASFDELDSNKGGLVSLDTVTLALAKTSLVVPPAVCTVLHMSRLVCSDCRRKGMAMRG